jgi:hypothetical protein
VGEGGEAVRRAERAGAVHRRKAADAGDPATVADPCHRGKPIRRTVCGMRDSRRGSGRENRAIPGACAECGTTSGDRKRRYCDGFGPELVKAAADAARKSGTEPLARLREGGTDPAHGGDAARKRAETTARHARDAEAWERQYVGQLDPEAYLRNVLPRLPSVSLSSMVEFTGLSLRYCSLIRRGKVPHPRHRDALSRLVEESVRRQSE